jgi:exo-beta-1,3-glucanase (GH17 family)
MQKMKNNLKKTLFLCACLAFSLNMLGQITITHIPPIGTGGNAEGKIEWNGLSANNVGEYAVIAMLRTGIGYVKPYYTDYLNTIDEQGNFSINITSNANDYTVENVIFYFVLRSTFNGIGGESVNASYMNGKYLGQPVTINRNEFWEGRLLPPTPSILPGFVTAGSTITLSCQSCQPGESIRYTLDGSDPVSSSTAQTYSIGTSFTVPNTGSRLVRAVTTLSGLYSSPASFVWLPQEPLDKPFWGLNVSLALNGEAFGLSLSEATTRARMLPIAPLTKWVRTFGTINNGLEYINKIAKDELGLHTMIGVDVTKNASENNAQIQGLRQILETGPSPNFVVIGNECSLAGVSPVTLISCIDAVREVLAEFSLVIPVGSVDIMGASWSQSVLEKLDFVGVNIYSGTWDATADDQMLTALSQNYANAVASFPSKLVLLTETGTPYAGGAYITDDNATKTPSESKAKSYLCGFLEYIHTDNVPAFYFEAYNEPVKSQNGGHPIEQYFGLMDGTMVLHPFYQECLNNYPTAIITPDHAANITLYPNPVSDVFYIGELPAGATVTIIDVSGKIVKTYGNASETINVSHLPKGVYFVNVDKKILKMIKY